MSTSRDLKLSTCFLCLKSFKPNQDSSSPLDNGHNDTKSGFVSQKLLVFSENYFGHEVKDFLRDLKQLENNIFCANCYSRVSVVSSLYNNLCSLQTKLAEKTGELFDLLESSTKHVSGRKTRVRMETLAKQIGVEGVYPYKNVEEIRMNWGKFLSTLILTLNKSVTLSPGNSNSYNLLANLDSEARSDDNDELLDVKVENDCMDDNQNEQVSNGRDVLYNLEQEQDGERESIQSCGDAAINLPSDDGNCFNETDENSNPGSEGNQKVETEEEATSSDQYADDDSDYDVDINKRKRNKKLAKSTYNNRVYSCEKCNQTFSSRKSLKDHSRSTHDRKMLKDSDTLFGCDLCQMRFRLQGSLAHHRRVKHNIKLKKGPKPSSSKKRSVHAYTCGICEKTYLKKGALDKHKRKIHSSKKECLFVCNLCRKEFSSKGNLTRHIKLKHEDTPIESHSTSLEQEAEEASMTDTSSESPDNNSDFSEDEETEAVTRKKRTTLSTDKSNVHTCDKCIKAYSRRGALDKHMMKVHGVNKKASALYKCESCGKGFIAKGSLSRHRKLLHKMARNTPETPFQCEKCKGYFKTKKSLREHLQRAHNVKLPVPFVNRPCKCEICGRGSTNHYALVRHMNLSHGIARKLVARKFECPTCTNFYEDKYTLERHINIVHNSKKAVSCSTCAMGFDTRRQLIHHKYEVHKKNKITLSFLKRLQGAKGNTNDEMRGKCVVCAQDFTSWEILRAHLKIHEDQVSLDNKSLMCYMCHKLFAHEQTIWAHLRSSKTHDYTKVEFPCDHLDHMGYAQWVYQNPSELEEHFKLEHTNCTVLKCPDCSWPFLDTNMLELHRLVHIPKVDKKYHCPICHSPFLNHESLQNHYNPVHGVSLKIYRCQNDKCSWVFATKRGLANHLKVHEAEQKGDATNQDESFLCTECPSIFPTAFQLRDHMRLIHVTAPCVHCGILVQRSKLSHHRAGCGGKKPKHLCTLCGKTYSNASMLRLHMAFHGEYHFNCQYCGKGCRSGHYLRVHIRRDHKDKVVDDDDGMIASGTTAP